MVATFRININIIKLEGVASLHAHSACCAPRASTWSGNAVRPGDTRQRQSGKADEGNVGARSKKVKKGSETEKG